MERVWIAARGDVSHRLRVDVKPALSSSRDVPVVDDVTPECLDAKFDAEREVKGDCSGGCDGLRMSPKLQCLFFCEAVVACRFLGGLSTTVSTGTGFVLWNSNEHPIPVEPRRIEM